MAAYRLLLFDLDGTLLTQARRVHERNLEVLQELMRQGVLVSLATGRSPKSAAKHVQQLGPKVPLIHFNGALVRDVGTGEIVFQRKLPYAHALSALAVGAEMGLHANLYIDDDILIDHRTQVSRTSEAKDGVPHTVVGDLLEHLMDLRRDPIKLLFIGEPDLFEAFAEEVAMATSGGCEVVNSEPDYFEVLPPGVSKETAMVELALHLSVDIEEVIAFGDNLNDLEMLRSAGMGVAMGNSHEAVLKAADVVLDTNDTDAIAFFLECEFRVEKGRLTHRRG